VIPYIASNFKKDQIWLRRTKPSKRQYQVMVAIDDSESMQHYNAGYMACEALVVIARALTQLEVGELSIIKFGESVQLLHPFDRPFTDEAGCEIISQFTFKQQRTETALFMETAVNILELARMVCVSSVAPFS